jgi:hypothetical protein
MDKVELKKQPTHRIALRLERSSVRKGVGRRAEYGSELGTSGGDRVYVVWWLASHGSHECEDVRMV